MKKLSIVVPVYFNEGSIPELGEELLKLEKGLLVQEMELEIIFVDDGSGDGSLRELLRFKERRPATKIIKLTRNFGSVPAIKAGLKFVTGDCFVRLAADLQDPPEYVLEMVPHWKRGMKFVICVRQSRQDPFLTRLFARVYLVLLRWLVVPNYPAGGYDLAIMDQAMLPYMRDCGKNMNPNVLGFSLGFSPAVIYYDRRERRHGRSRWTFVKKINYLLDTFVGFSVKPLRLISMAGLVISACSMAYGIYIFYNAIFGHFDVPGFATTAILISFLQGLVLCMLGIVGEYIWRILEQVNNKPESVIDDMYL